MIMAADQSFETASPQFITENSNHPKKWCFSQKCTVDSSSRKGLHLSIKSRSQPSPSSRVSMMGMTPGPKYSNLWCSRMSYLTLGKECFTGHVKKMEILFSIRYSSINVS